jgi:CheY-like chemotaxis protein
MSTILVVDDHPIAREPLAKLLRHEGYETACASNGAEALAALNRCAADLILLDVMMPKMGGIAFLEAARRDPRWKDLPVIVLTGLLEGAELRRVRELKVCEVITKAKFTVEDLLTLVRSHLSH